MSRRVGAAGAILGLAALAGLAVAAKAEPSGFSVTAGKRHRFAGMVVPPPGVPPKQFAEGVAQGLRASGMTEVNVTPGELTTFSYVAPPAPASVRIAAEIPFVFGGVSAPFRLTSVEPV